jgi:hypothetical protein
MAETTVASLQVELKALTTKFEAQMERATKAVYKSSYGIKKSLKTVELASQVALAQTAIGAIQKFGQSLGDLAGRADELDDLSGTFEALGGNAGQLQAAKDALLGTASSIDLLKVANQGLLKDIPGFAENFGLLADYSGRFAEATGTDAVEGLKKLTGALTTGKEAQLRKLGILIDVDKAYQDYAVSIGKASDKLTDAEKRTARQTAAVAELARKNAELAPMADSVNAALDAIGISLSDGTAEMFRGIAASEDFIKILRSLADVIASIPWREFGYGMAEVISHDIKLVNELRLGLANLLPASVGDFLRTDFEEKTAEIVRLRKELESLPKQANARRIGIQQRQIGYTEEELAAAKKNLTEQILAIEGEVNKVIEEQKAKQVAMISKIATIDSRAGGGGKPPKDDPVVKRVAAIGEEAEKSARDIEALTEKWRSFVEGEEAKKLEGSIQGAIDQLNKADFTRLTKQLEKSVYDGFVDEWKEAIDSGAVSFDEVAKRAKEAASEAANSYRLEFDRATQKVTNDLADAFDRVAGSISELSQAIGVDLSGVVAQLNRLPEKSKADIASSLGIGGGNGQEGAAALAYIETILQVAGAAASAKGKDKESQSGKGTGEAVGMGIGAAVGAIGGPIGSAIGAAVGRVIGGFVGGMFKWGPQNPESKARHAFANFVEEGFEKLGAVSFRDAQNRMQTISGRAFNLFEGASTRFNAPGWADSMSALNDEARSTFLGLGEGFRNLLGIAEDVGGQIGFILAENLSGNIDNARLLVEQLGVSFEDMEKALMEAALNGKISWSEFEIQLVGLSNAFKPGLAAVGDMAGAMENLIGSGGRGVAALRGVRDTAVEAMEAGARTIEEMGQRMIAMGVDPTAVNAFILAIRERGIQTLEELAQASDRVAGGIVAELASNDEAIRSQWGRMADELKGIAEIIETIPTEKDIQLNVKTNFDKNTQQFISAGGMNLQASTNRATAFANGGLVSGPMAFSFGGGKMGIAGEAGAEAILPLTKVGGKLGVMAVGSAGGGGNVYHIDARGADIGVEKRIRMALVEVENRAVRRSVNAMGEGLRRGGRF